MYRNRKKDYYSNRTACDVLYSMRQCLEKKSYKPLPAMVEELQYYFDRMESGLADQKDLISLRNERSELKAEVMKLRKKVKKK